MDVKKHVKVWCPNCDEEDVDGVKWKEDYGPNAGKEFECCWFCWNSGASSWVQYRGKTSDASRIEAVHRGLAFLWREIHGNKV